MRVICALISALVVAGQPQPLPPPFPRPNAVKMLDNDRVQVWSVAWPKGQPTPLHRHIYDITGTYIASGDRVITEVDGSKRPVTNVAGGIVWQFKGLTHIEEGTSESPLRAVMIDLKGRARKTAAGWRAGVLRRCSCRSTTIASRLGFPEPRRRSAACIGTLWCLTDGGVARLSAGRHGPHARTNQRRREGFGGSSDVSRSFPRANGLAGLLARRRHVLPYRGRCRPGSPSPG